jgi:hypothetical protein
MSDDDAQIRSLLGRAAHLADEGTPEDYRTLYTPDATWSMGGSTQTGVEEIVAATRQRRSQGVSGPGTGTRHFVVPMHVTVEGDKASAVSYFLFLGDTATAPVVKLFGVYTDDLVRTAAGWRIARRVSRAG